MQYDTPNGITLFNTLEIDQHVLYSMIMPVQYDGGEQHVQYDIARLVRSRAACENM